MIVSPLLTPAPVTGVDRVTVVPVVEETTVPDGMTVDAVVSETTMPTEMEPGTEANVNVLPDAVAALATRLTLMDDPGGVAHPPLALRNIFASASPAAGAGTRPDVPPEPLSPVKGESVAGVFERSV